MAPGANGAHAAPLCLGIRSIKVDPDPLTGDLLIAVENLKDGFVVQVEMFAGGEIIDS